MIGLKEKGISAITGGLSLRVDFASFCYCLNCRSIQGEFSSVHLYMVKIAVSLQRIPVKIVFDPTVDRDRILMVGMSVEPTVIAK